MSDEIQHNPVGGEITLFGNFIENITVFIFIFVNVVLIDIKKGIVLQPARLMDLEI